MLMADAPSMNSPSDAATGRRTASSALPVSRPSTGAKVAGGGSLLLCVVRSCGRRGGVSVAAVVAEAGTRGGRAETLVVDKDS